jgi:hypothetical protein
MYTECLASVPSVLGTEYDVPSARHFALGTDLGTRYISKFW